MDLTVIIPVYNAAALIERCLDSVLKQVTRYSFEIICVDDGSADDSVAIIEKRNDSRISVIKQQNAGPAAARNRGVESAKGRYVAFLDADDYWEDGFIEQTVSFLEAHPECVAVSVGQRHLTVSGEFVAPGCMAQYPKPVVVDDFFGFWARHQHVCTGSAVLRTDMVRQTGGQRTEMRVTEDLEFWLYTATLGKWGFVPKVLFVSDGSKVTEQIGWLEKMKVRWYNAPSMAEWRKRIDANISPAPSTKLPFGLTYEGYRMALGKIAQNLSYCHLLSERTDMALEETKEYGDSFCNGTGRLMNMAKHTCLTWWMACKLLQWREYHR